ncbi:MAG: DNA-binding protein [Tissierellales bacterium]|nr:DNA-binding protein [Tissierellales bacterium]MBN2827982.1 DNA-binding protein [Tissierellales bacterium]
MLDKYEEIGKLYDYYSPLLKDNHREVLELYYFQDLSLTEIAEILNVTRQGVFDLLKRAEMNLKEFEEKLMLIEKNRQISSELVKIREAITHNHHVSEITKKIDHLIESL